MAAKIRCFYAKPGATLNKWFYVKADKPLCCCFPIAEHFPEEFNAAFRKKRRLVFEIVRVRGAVNPRSDWVYSYADDGVSSTMRMLLEKAKAVDGDMIRWRVRFPRKGEKL